MLDPFASDLTYSATSPSRDYQSGSPQRCGHDASAAAADLSDEWLACSDLQPAAAAASAFDSNSTLHYSSAWLSPPRDWSAQSACDERQQQHANSSDDEHEWRQEPQQMYGEEDENAAPHMRDEWEAAEQANVAAVPSAFHMHAASLQPHVASFLPSHAASESSHTPSSSVAHSSPAPAARTVPASKRACTACNKLKVRCPSDVRPCPRCVEFGRVCCDRTDEEVSAARLQRKRKIAITKQKNRQQQQLQQQQQHSSQSVSSGSSAETPFASFASLSTAATDLISRQLYSRSHLAQLMAAGLRDKILEMHTKLRVLPHQVATLLAFPVYSNLAMLIIADTLTQEDLLLFIQSGLTEAQIDSPAFQSSPLAPWTKLSTRPMHRAFQSNSLECGRGDLTRPHSTERSPEAIALDDATAPAQCRITWMPEAVFAFDRWKRMCQVTQENRRKLGADSMAQHLSSFEVSSEQERKEKLAELWENLKQQRRSDEMVSIVENMCSLSIDAPTIGHQPHGDLDSAVNLHALFCPQSESRLMLDSMHKRQRTQCSSHSNSASPNSNTPASMSDSSSVGSADNSACLCELSVALPMLVQVNSSFERMFGWSQAEVNAGVVLEGLSFLRRFSPPSQWPALHRAEALHWRGALDTSIHLINAISNQLAATAAAEAAGTALPSAEAFSPNIALVQDAAATAATSAAEDHQKVIASRPLENIPSQLVTKCGQIRECVMSKIDLQGAGNNPGEHVHEWRVHVHAANPAAAPAQ